MDLTNFPSNETAQDMMSMISPIYDKSYVGKWIFQVMGEQLGIPVDIIKTLQNEMFPETATLLLYLWEQRYGIDVNTEQPIEDQRKAVIAKRNFRKPMNPAKIEKIVSDTCGRDTRFDENTSPGTFTICILSGETNAVLDAIVAAVKKVKQSHKSFDVFFETNISLRIRAEPQSKVFPHRITSSYAKTGRYPDVANIGSVTRLQLQASFSAHGVGFPYTIAGKKPDISNIAKLTRGGIATSASGSSAKVAYKMCGSRKL